jgi:hypothetical protein
LIRETLLIHLPTDADRDALRRVGKLVYELALESDQSESTTTYSLQVELDAVAAELRYLHGYLLNVEKGRQNASLSAAEERHARFAGRLARRLSDVITFIESRPPSAPAQIQTAASPPEETSPCHG